MLSSWNTDKTPITVLTENHDEVQIPVSTQGDVKSIILLDNHQFITSDRRWSIEFDYDCSRSQLLNNEVNVDVTPITTEAPISEIMDTTELFDLVNSHESLLRDANMNANKEDVSHVEPQLQPADEQHVTARHDKETSIRSGAEASMPHDSAKGYQHVDVSSSTATPTDPEPTLRPNAQATPTSIDEKVERMPGIASQQLPATQTKSLKGGQPGHESQAIPAIMPKRDKKRKRKFANEDKQPADMMEEVLVEKSMTPVQHQNDTDYDSP